MILQHNLLAMTANRQLGINNKEQQKKTETLSSGYRINRACDDAAGLTISEKMRGQVRGLNRASDNIGEGISLVQTAEGALNETHSILQRMRELAVQAANDTNTTDDRAIIQNEVSQLIEEVDRIAYQTEYNNGIYPLLGGGEGITSAQIFEKSVTIVLKQNLTYDGVNYNVGDTVTITGMSSNGREVLFDRGAWYDPGTFMTVTSPCFSVHSSDLRCDENGHIYITSKADGVRAYFMLGNDANDTSPDPIIEPTESQCAVYLARGYTYCTMRGSGFTSVQNLWIQAGANSNQGICIPLVDATAKGIGLGDIRVMSCLEATNSITDIDHAISVVNEYRSSFGAQQNRLVHAMAIDDNTAENLQSAESRIRDADMAEEMVEYSKYGILSQAGQAILAQAGQMPEGILSLLS